MTFLRILPFNRIHRRTITRSNSDSGRLRVEPNPNIANLGEKLMTDKPDAEERNEKPETGTCSRRQFLQGGTAAAAVSTRLRRLLLRPRPLPH